MRHLQNRGPSAAGRSIRKSLRLDGLCYNDAIQTLISLAGQFGPDELTMPMLELFLAILMVQFVAFFGAMGFGKVAAASSAKKAEMLSLGIWPATLVYIYLAVTTPRLIHFGGPGWGCNGRQLGSHRRRAIF